MSQEVRVIYKCDLCGEQKDSIFGIRITKIENEPNRLILMDKTVSETGTHVCADCIAAVENYVIAKQKV